MQLKVILLKLDNFKGKDGREWVKPTMVDISSKPNKVLDLFFSKEEAKNLGLENLPVSDINDEIAILNATFDVNDRMRARLSTVAAE